MESLQKRYNLTGANLASDPDIRMRSRPAAVTPGKGRAHDDFGSDLKSPRGRQKSKQRGSRPVTRGSSIDTDELDFLSQESKGSADEVKTVDPSLKGAVQGPDGVRTIEGINLKYAKGFEPKKLPKFTKTKAADANQPSSKAVGSSKHSASSSKVASMRKRLPSPKPPNEKRRLPPDNRHTSSSNTPPSEYDAQETPRVRPRPRPLHKNVAKKDPAPAPFLDMLPNSQETHNVLSAVQNQPSRSPRSKNSNLQRQAARQPAAFPSLSPVSTPVMEFPKLRPQAFPTLSPPGFQNLKGKQRSLTHEQEEAEPEGSFTSSKASVKPFPLSDQFFNSNQTSPVSKRLSKEDDYSDVSPRKKRKCDRLNDLIYPYPLLDEPSGINEQDLLFLDTQAAVDPSTLCPWCDEPLPPEPTPHLMSLIESVRMTSSPEERSSNPLGLKASIRVYVTVCKRHRFESHQIPLAKVKGWPTQIDFSVLKDRVEALKDDLEMLILNRYPDTLPGDSDDSSFANGSGNRPRSKSVFWQELIGDVKAKGTRAMASAKGQFANFDKLQPGYYGELGYIIISQTIYQLFPPSSINPAAVAPLTPQEFTQRILVPEAAVGLIMEDQKSKNRNKAVETLRESVEYGVAMFPDSGEGGEAVDKMIRERAKTRRKELEVEDALDGARNGSRNQGDVRHETRSPSASAERSSRPKPRRKVTRREAVAEGNENAVGPGGFNYLFEGKNAPTTRRLGEDSESDTTDASTTSYTKPTSTNHESPSSRRMRTPSVSSESDVQIISDHSTSSKRRGSSKAKALPKKAVTVCFEDPLGRNSSPNLHNEDGNLEATPRAIKMQIRPLEKARTRKLDRSVHSPSSINLDPERLTSSWLLSSDDTIEG